MQCSGGVVQYSALGAVGLCSTLPSECTSALCTALVYTAIVYTALVYTADSTRCGFVAGPRFTPRRGRVVSSRAVCMHWRFVVRCYTYAHGCPTIRRHLDVAIALSYLVCSEA